MNPDGSGSGNDDNQEEGDPNGETSGVDLAATAMEKTKRTLMISR